MLQRQVEQPDDAAQYPTADEIDRQREGQKAGTKVTFQILAVSAYSVYTFSEVYEYTVQEESEPEPMPNPEAN